MAASLCSLPRGRVLLRTVSLLVVLLVVSLAPSPAASTTPPTPARADAAAVALPSPSPPRSAPTSPFASFVRPFILPRASRQKGEQAPTAAAAAAAANSDTDSAMPPQGAGEERRTCRICHQSYVASANHDKACRYHPGNFLGNERSKFLGTRSGGPNVGLARFWDCCGSEDPLAEGCTPCRHRGYDE